MFVAHFFLPCRGIVLKRDGAPRGKGALLAAGMVLRRLSYDLVCVLGFRIFDVLEEQMIGVAMITVLLFASITDAVCKRFPKRFRIGRGKGQPEDGWVFLQHIGPHCTAPC